MKFSKSLLVLPLASFFFAAAVGAGACSSSVSLDIETAPTGFKAPDGITLGQPCQGDVYVADSDGTSWVVCDNGIWDYTTSDPADVSGYEVYSADDGGIGTGPDGSVASDDGSTGTGDGSTSTGDGSTGTGDSSTSTGDGSTGTSDGSSSEEASTGSDGSTGGDDASTGTDGSTGGDDASTGSDASTGGDDASTGSGDAGGGGGASDAAAAG